MGQEEGTREFLWKKLAANCKPDNGYQFLIQLDSRLNTPEAKAFQDCFDGGNNVIPAGETRYSMLVKESSFFQDLIPVLSESANKEVRYPLSKLEFPFLAPDSVAFRRWRVAITRKFHFDCSNGTADPIRPMISTLKYSQKLLKTHYVNHLVSVSTYSFLSQVIAREPQALDSKATSELRSIFQSYLREMTQSYLQAVEFERKSLKASVDRFLKNPDDPLYKMDSEEKSLEDIAREKIIANLLPVKKSEMSDTYMRWAFFGFEQEKGWLKKPENQWINLDTDRLEKLGVLYDLSVISLRPKMEIFFTLLGQSFGYGPTVGSISRLVERRHQARLFLTYLDLVDYRNQRGFYPVKLSDIGKKQTKDSVSGTPYHYSRSADGQRIQIAVRAKQIDGDTEESDSKRLQYP